MTAKPSESAPRGDSFERGPDAPVKVDRWELREETLPVGEQALVSETLFSVGNGLVGVRGYAEETEAGQNRHERSERYGSRYRSYNSSMREASSSEVKGKPSSLKVSDSRSGSRTVSVTGSGNGGTGTTAQRGVYFSGFYEQHPLMYPRSFSVGISTKETFRLRAPDAFCVDAFLSGEHISAARGPTRSHVRRLDLRTGEVHRKFVWYSNQQHREVTIETRRFVSTARKNISVMHYKMSVKNAANTDVRLISRIFLSAAEYDVETMYTQSNIQDSLSIVFVCTRNSCRHLVVASVETCSSCQFKPGIPAFPYIDSASPTKGKESTFTSSPALAGPSVSSSPSNATVAPSTILTPSNRETEWGTETSYTSCFSGGMTIEIVKVVGHFGDEDATAEDLMDVATHQTREAAALGYDGLLAEHCYVMNNFWETADVRVEPNAAVQGAFRFNILQTYMSASGSPYYCFPTRGLTGDMLLGVQQWDVDALIVPFLAHVSPEKARALLEFRIRTMNEARDMAADLSLPRGALFPFRTVTGEKNPTPYCGAFLFVNAVVVYALREYVTTTHDTSILVQGGAELVFTTALVWLQWGSWEKGWFHLRSVSGPDTYNDEADNNYFTNLMAQMHLQWAVQMAIMLRQENPEMWKDIMGRAQMTEKDIIAMDHAAAKMVLPFDGNHRIHPMDQSFMRKKHWNLTSLKDSSDAALHTLYHPTVIYRHQVCRIPDVMLAIMLAPEKFSHDEAKADFTFYEAVTAPDSAMRLAIFSVVASTLRLSNKAMSYFHDALFVDIDNLIGNSGGGLHSTAAAGSWFSMAVGICGLRVVQGVLHFNPALYEEMEEFEFHARHRGCLVRVFVTQRLVTYTLVRAPEGVTDLMLVHAGVNRITLRPGHPETVRLFHEVRVFDFDCIIFELDSVVSDIESVHYQAWTQTLEEYFHQHGFADFAMTKELYLAYLCHVKPFYGLNEIFKKYNKPLLPAGEPTDTVESNSLYGLCNRKLLLFRAYATSHGMPLRDGVLQFISLVRQYGIAVGCVSGSKNARWVINETAKGSSIFDSFLEGKEGAELGLRWRPEMDYFEACARRMDAATNRAVVVMDGIDGFSKKALEKFRMVVDVSLVPEEAELSIPRLLAKSLRDITIETLNEYTVRGGVVNHLREM
ncbi:putative glycosyl hydrolase [Leptomonas seymouri]|uniref:Putative glycosyl hydrolase n=1 Tax=Leptomonas seymouri TaxID=5684 RepID=A0A0N1PBB4_LEPSE|nr:putative glycosyl hydrolase [Leptomonas seymouri]|eukprot:KPI85025.1 putative glycosyl hydrolase [Leptomonas seymouri]